MTDSQTLDLQTPAAKRPTGHYWERTLLLLSRVGAYLPGELLIVLLPLLLLAYDSSWLFPRPDTVDPWMYVAYYLSPRFQLSAFAGVYHGTRLPIILPGTLAFKVFAPDVAIIVLHLVFYYIATFSLYGTLRWLLERRTALLATLIFGSNAMFISVIGQTHADSCGVSYALLTIFLVTAAVKGPFWRLTLFVAGVTAALFLFTNLAYFPAATVFLWLLITLPRDRLKKPLKPGLVFVFAGLVACTIGLGLANRMLGSGFFFFRPWLAAMIGMLPNAAVCANPSQAWVFHASWLVFPVAAFAAGLAVWRTGWLDRNDQPAVFRSLVGSFGLVVASLLGFEVLQFIHYLQFSFYASLLIPSLFVAIGALLGLFVPHWPEKTWQYALAAAFVFGLGVLLPINGNALRGATVWLLPALILGAGVLLLVRPQISAQHLPAVSVGLFAIANIFVSNNYDRFLTACPLERTHVAAVKFVGGWQDPIRGRKEPELTPSRRRAFRLAAEAYRVLSESDPVQTYCLWFSVKEPNGAVYTAISAMYMWEQRFLSPCFPQLVDVYGTPAEVPEWLDNVAILSESSRDVVTEAREALTGYRRDMEVVGEHDFTERFGIPIKMTMIRVSQPKPVEVVMGE